MPEVPSSSESPREKPKRETSVSRVIGFNEEQEKDLSVHLKDTFEKQSEKEVFEGTFLKEYEREKTEEEKQIIMAILEQMANFIKRYGGRPIDITLDYIHILNKEKLDEGFRKKTGIEEEQGGGYDPHQQLIYIVDAGNNLENTQRIVHEILHFNSFQSIELTEKGKNKFNIRRVGFEVHSKKQKEIFFTEINEAITEELAKRFDIEYFPSMSEIAEEIKDREIVKKAAKGKGDDIARVKTEELEGGKRKYVVERYTYIKERKKLQEIMQDIYEKNPEEFSSKEEVFAIFAEAALSGKLLKVARIIEKTYKSEENPHPFRKIGEETKKK